jgi:hypothetical protein
MKRHMIPFATTQDGDRELFELAFSKKKTDERKEWLRQYKVCWKSAQVASTLTPTRAMYIARNVLGPYQESNPIFGFYQQRTHLILDGG